MAIQRDLPIMTGANTADEDVLGIRQLYSERCTAASKSPQLADMPFFRLAYVAEDETRAREDPREALTWVRDLNGLRRTLTGGSEIYMDLEHWRQTRTTRPPSYEAQLQSTAYFGTPDQMVGWIRHLQQTYQVGYFGVNMAYGNLSHAKVMRSMELFAQEVIPRFR